MAVTRKHYVIRLNWWWLQWSTAAIIALMITFAVDASTTSNSLVIVSNTQSDYRIIHRENVPSSVREAAQELQRYIKEATGVRLPIQVTDSAPDARYICLGAHSCAQRQGLNTHDVPPEGFRIVTRGDHLFILGPDTPDGTTTDRGGFSTGTRNGVYVFLEDYLDVRWLMPGERGDDVPRSARLAIPRIDRVDSPSFQRRRMPVIQAALPEVKQWMNRLRLGASMEINHYHNWHNVIPASMYDEHPDWFAMVDGERVKPEEGDDRYKLETTNPQVIHYFAETAKRSFREDPDLYCFSLSPTDSANFSQSPESLAMQEEGWQGQQSATPLIIKFYNDVATLVRPEFPDRVLGGYIYSNYFYPPRAGIPELEPNLFLVIVPSNHTYGFKMYRDHHRQRWLETVPFWGEKLTHAGYYDLPHKVIQSLGAPTPLGLDMFELIFPVLDRYNFESLYIYGLTCWSHGAASNYVLAGLMWDPTLDIRARADEFFRRAYGREAGDAMRRLYDTVRQSMLPYYRNHEEARYMLTDEIIEGVYVPIYPELESLYLEARSKASTPDHLARLEMFGKALILFRWNLEHMGVIEVDASSPLHRTDEQIDQMLNEPNTWMLLSPDPDRDFPRTRKVVNPARMRSRAAELQQGVGEKQWSTKGTLNIVVVPEGERFSVICPELDHVGESPRLWIRDAENRTVMWAMIREGRRIEVPVEAGRPYLVTTTGSRARYTIVVDGAVGLKD